MPSLEINSQSLIPGTNDLYQGVVRFFKNNQVNEMYSNRIIAPMLIDDKNPMLKVLNATFSGTLVLWVTGLK